MKSQARKIKRMAARRQELLREIENRERIWKAAMAGDSEARMFLSKQYWGMQSETKSANQSMAFVKSA